MKAVAALFTGGRLLQFDVIDTGRGKSHLLTSLKPTLSLHCSFGLHEDISLFQLLLEKSALPTCSYINHDSVLFYSVEPATELVEARLAHDPISEVSSDGVKIPVGI